MKGGSLNDEIDVEKAIWGGTVSSAIMNSVNMTDLQNVVTFLNENRLIGNCIPSGQALVDLTINMDLDPPNFFDQKNDIIKQIEAMCPS